MDDALLKELHRRMNFGGTTHTAGDLDLLAEPPAGEALAERPRGG